MVPPEYSRSPQPRRRKPFAVLIVLLVLCLVAFSVGVFVGKRSGATAQVTAVPVTTPVAVPSPASTSVVTVVGRPPVKPRQLVEDHVAATTEPVAETIVAEMKKNSPPAASSPQGTAQVRITTSSDTPPTVVVNNSGGDVLVHSQGQAAPLGSGINGAVKAAAPVVEKPLVTAAPAVKPPVKKTAPAVAVTPAGSYAVQVGAFKTRADAGRLQKRLHGQFSSVVKRVDLGSKGVWFRVLAGPVATADDAALLKKQLQQKLKIAGFVKKYRP